MTEQGGQRPRFRKYERTERGFVYPWERAFERVMTPFEEFVDRQTTGGLVLMACAVVALLVANSPLWHAYHAVIHAPVGLRVGPWTLERSVAHWVSEGLMVFFFFTIGLEIKREILVGELSSLRKAALPVIAAVGGMLAPALIYFAINRETGFAHGWGIPTATDIAFCIGVLVLLGPRVPQGLTMFLVALAIADDLGAVVVIAIFYTAHINLAALLGSAGLLGLLIAFNFSGVRNGLPYLVVGFFMWLGLLFSGIHATIAGVLTAFCIPAFPRYHPQFFAQRGRELLDRFEAGLPQGQCVLTQEEQATLLQNILDLAWRSESPLQRLLHTHHKPVAFLVIPAFALTSAGIPVDFSAFGATLGNPVTLGVMAGLVLGKFVGISLFTWLAVASGITSLPTGIGMREVMGVGLLGGIGFTMSMFISELSFVGDPEVHVMAKTGIIMASVLAGTLGYLWLRFLGRPEPVQV